MALFYTYITIFKNKCQKRMHVCICCVHVCMYIYMYVYDVCMYMHVYVVCLYVSAMCVYNIVSSYVYEVCVYMCMSMCICV